MNRGLTTLTQFLIEERRRFPGATGELNGLILSVALACKSMATHVSHGALAGIAREPCECARDAAPRDLAALADETFLRSIEWGGHAAAMVSPSMASPHVAPQGAGGKYLLVFDPLDGASNIDVNGSVGSIFSILRLPPGADGASEGERVFLQPGTAQVAAGYAIYGPSTMLVLTVGNGTHGFTLERSIGEFVLTHRDLRIPEGTAEFAINSSNSRFWEAPIQRYVDECLRGEAGPRGRDFSMRWIASLVAEAHRILLRGGVFLHPRDRRDREAAGNLDLLHEANPIAFLVEQAGGRSSTGRAPILGIVPGELHQRVGFVFGSREEVERIERCHAEDVEAAGADLPLFQSRGLFRDSLAA